MADYKTLSVSVFPETGEFNMLNVTFKIEVVTCKMKAIPQLCTFCFCLKLSFSIEVKTVGVLAIISIQPCCHVTLYFHGLTDRQNSTISMCKKYTCFALAS